MTRPWFVRRMTEHGVTLERSLILEGRPYLTQRVLKDWPANEPDVDPAQASAADARNAHRRAVRQSRLGFRGQVRRLPDDRGNPAGQGCATAATARSSAAVISRSPKRWR